MLSLETEAKAAKLFLILSEGEKSIEISRQLLSDQIDFNSYQVFKQFDKDSKTYIDAYDIVDFLKLFLILI